MDAGRVISKVGIGYYHESFTDRNMRKHTSANCMICHVDNLSFVIRRCSKITDP